MTQDAQSHSNTATQRCEVTETQVTETQRPGIGVSEFQSVGGTKRKRGARLESPAVPYISTPDGLFWTKGVFFGA